jgi:folate-binding protein YgfZ
MTPLWPQLASDYEALSRGEGIVDVSDRTKLELRGSDRASFLHNFCTNDIKRLQPGDSCEAFVCNVKGHVLAHVQVLCREDVLWLDTVAGQAERLAAHLDRYLIREDVQIVDRTEELAAYFVCNERPGSFRIGIAPSAHIVWLEKGERPETIVCSRHALDILRVEHGYPWFGVDITEENLPQEVNRNEQAISFTKGCYLGQETVARIDALGHVNKTLCQVSFPGPRIPEAGEQLISDGKTIGHVTSAVWSPQLNAPLALAYVRRGHNAVGSKLSSSVGDATVVAL